MRLSQELGAAHSGKEGLAELYNSNRELGTKVEVLEERIRMMQPVEGEGIGGRGSRGNVSAGDGRGSAGGEGAAAEGE